MCFNCYLKIALQHWEYWPPGWPFTKLINSTTLQLLWSAKISHEWENFIDNTSPLSSSL